ncbi:MAG: quinonprotein alcohol dehydrogenase [Rhodospirillales bacterium]|nr:quinonprotein alcohol dehydrogenase [Rhodospirillales bacterium]
MLDKHALLTTAALLALGLSVSANAANDLTKPAGKDWPAVGGDWNNSRFSTLTKINPSNVKTLGAAWLKQFPGAYSRITPVVADGMMFVTAGPFVYALNPKTGEEIWKYKPEIPASMLFKGVAYGEGKVFVGTADASIFALDAKTGKFLWNTLVGDKLPPRDAGPGGANAAALTTTGQYISGAPIYVNGKVISGMANGDFLIIGRLMALDAKTGKEAWRFDSVQGPGKPGHETWQQDNEVWKHGGGGMWVTPVADPKLNLVYVGTGNPIPQWAGETRGGDNLFTDTALALDITTGKLKWHFQAIHHDIWEADLGTPFVLFDANKDGKTTPAIGIMRTDGILFELDRATGKPVFPIEERAVPQNPRLKTSPTQPFPVGADQIGPPCTPPELIPAGFKPICYFDPIDYDTPNAMILLNKTRSAPMAYSPQSGLFYATAHISPFWISRAQDPDVFVPPGNAPGMKSYGLITAIDAKTEKIVWQNKVPYRIENGSGATVTAGGLLFHGEPDGNLQAYEAKTGDKLWEFQTGADEGGSAAIYEVDGEQYVAVMASSNLWAFKLGGTVAPLPAPPTPATETTFRGRLENADHIGISATLNDMGLDKTRTYYDENVFKPLRAKVKTGAITFTNDGKEPHTPTAVDGSWTTGEIAPGKSATVTIATPGTYVYSDKLHPWSYGQLVVQ